MKISRITTDLTALFSARHPGKEAFCEAIFQYALPTLCQGKKIMFYSSQTKKKKIRLSAGPPYPHIFPSKVKKI